MLFFYFTFFLYTIPDQKSSYKWWRSHLYERVTPLVYESEEDITGLKSNNSENQEDAIRLNSASDSEQEDKLGQEEKKTLNKKKHL